MALQVAKLAERLGTAGMSTFVRLVARVRAYVLLKMTQLSELPLAYLASIRLYTKMYPRVLREIRRICERLRALRTLVRFRLSHVNLRVKLQIRFAPEYLQQTSKNHSNLSSMIGQR